jgi:hypothetical protein
VNPWAVVRLCVFDRGAWAPVHDIQGVLCTEELTGHLYVLDPNGGSQRVSANLLEEDLSIYPTLTSTTNLHYGWRYVTADKEVVNSLLKEIQGE